MTKRPPLADDTEALLEAALDHLRHGRPITLNLGKKPLGIGWTATYMGKRWQEKEWPQAETRRAYRVYPGLNPGLLWGPKSGIIDFEADSDDEEQAFADLFEGCEIPTAPTFSSRRGKHRLFAWHPALQQIGKAEVKFNGLAIKIGANCKGSQSVLPPGKTNGITRQWLVPLDECDPPALPEQVVQRIIPAAYAPKKPETQQAQQTQAMANVSATSTVLTVSTVFHPECSGRSNRILNSSTVDAAIAATLPSGHGQRNAMLFKFARYLKSIPELAAGDVKALRPFVEKWHALALPNIATKDFSDSWFDFVNAWKSAKYPIGEDPILMMYQEAIAGEFPKAADQYPEPKLKQLVALCKRLQQEKGGAPFFLDCRAAGRLIDIPHLTAWRWLNGLVGDDVLKLEKVGTRHRASEYRYLGD